MQSNARAIFKLSIIILFLCLASVNFIDVRAVTSRVMPNKLVLDDPDKPFTIFAGDKGRVPFDHQIHSKKDSCVTCHHTNSRKLTAEVQEEVQQCASCHKADDSICQLEGSNEDKRFKGKVALSAKDAYHGIENVAGCIGCHRERQIEPTSCQSCHSDQPNRQQPEGPAQPNTSLSPPLHLPVRKQRNPINYSARATALISPIVSTDTKPAEIKFEIEKDSKTSLALYPIIATPVSNNLPILQPVEFQTEDKRSGWMVQLLRRSLLANPTYANGRIFVGGGFGSDKFYAFDADTGRLIWQTDLSDNGATAAVVEDGFVAFNTESCTLFVLSAETGKVVWQEWLGDPMMSQPAISEGRLYLAYPGKDGYQLLCANLMTGAHIWQQPISAELISAPVISDGRVYGNCHDGNSYCFDAVNGQLIWRKQTSATSAPIIVGDQMIYTERAQQGEQAFEGLQIFNKQNGSASYQKLIAASAADYFRPGTNSARNLDHLGLSSVVSGWSFQGARVAHQQGLLFNSQGTHLNCINLKDGKINWRVKLTTDPDKAHQQLCLPPAIGKKNIYLCTTDGQIICLSQQGELLFCYQIAADITSPPVLANGNIYLTTNNSQLICLKLDLLDTDGWYSWGGNSQHNR